MRLLHVSQMRGTLFFSVLMGDSRGYDAWGQQLAGGDWIGSEVFYQAPLYPYFLGVIYALFGHDLLVVRVIQAMIGALSSVAVGYATARLISPRAGLIAGVMLSLYPPAIFFDGLLQKSVLDVFLVSVSLAIIARILADGPDPRLWVTLGVGMGALALTRENALLLVVVILVWCGVRGVERTGHQRGTGRGGTETRRNTSTVVKKDTIGLFSVSPRLRGLTLRDLASASSFCFIIGVATVLAPVAIRNYSVAGEWYLTTSQFGSNLYIGNNPRADGSYMALREGRGSPEYERLDATDLAEQASGRRLSPSEVSSYWTAKTIGYVRSQPGDWLRLVGRKAWLLVSSTEIIDTESQESHAEYSWPLRLLGPVWHFGVLGPLAVIGAFALWSDRRRLWPLYVLTAVYAASVVLFFVVARYRLPLVPLLMVFGAGGVLALANTTRAALALAVLLALAANWPLHTAASQQAITENNLGTALQEAGRHEEAIAHYRRALVFQATYTPAMNNLGTALRATGRADEAVATYERALGSNADSVTLEVNRGNALMTQGRVAEAIAAFRQAVALQPGSSHATSALARALYDQGTAAIEAGAVDSAISTLREAIAVKSDYAEAHNNLGIALASRGNLRDAILEWETALRLAPDFVDARRNLELARRR